MNIVIVSDEPVLAELARRPLVPLRHEVTHLTTVAELLRRLAELAGSLCPSGSRSLARRTRH